MKKAPGQLQRLTIEALAGLKERLATGAPFKSYGEIVEWLKTEYNLELTYATVYAWVQGASHFCKYMKKGYNEKASKTVKKDEIKKMTPSDQQRLKAHLKGVAEILYKNTDSTELSNFESIEKSLRQKMLKEVGSELGRFFFQQYQELKQEDSEP